MRSPGPPRGNVHIASPSVGTAATQTTGGVNGIVHRLLAVLVSEGLEGTGPQLPWLLKK